MDLKREPCRIQHGAALAYRPGHDHRDQVGPAGLSRSLWEAPVLGGGRWWVAEMTAQGAQGGADERHD